MTVQGFSFLGRWLAFLFAEPLRLNFSSSKSSQSSSTATSNVSNDNRVGVGDNGVLVGDGSSVGNDNRKFDDHSSFAVTSNQATTNTTTNTTTGSNNDNRKFDDHSSFAVSTQSNDSHNRTTVDNHSVVDNRNLSDNSVYQATDNRVTNITNNSLDASVARGAIDASQMLAGEAGKMLAASYNFGDQISARSYAASQEALKLAVDSVSTGAAQDRAFAGEFLGKVFETTKSADQQTTAGLVKAVTVIVGIVAAVFAAVRIFGRKTA
ncbi:MAG: hypothetical protein RLZZ15_704 [Verrucomicrobiota bacterium]